jgi:hypothetical protein
MGSLREVVESVIAVVSAVAPDEGNTTNDDTYDRTILIPVRMSVSGSSNPLQKKKLRHVLMIIEFST